MNNQKPVLSVIILNYNAGQYIVNCLKSIDQSKLKYRVEVITADNCSTDTSFADCQKLDLINPLINYKFHDNKDNCGFAAGNNRALKVSDPETKYVLFLNPDTTVDSDTFQKMIDFFDSDPTVDAATCYINFALTGELQPESHRGFPTPLNAFWHFFGFGLPKLFPKSKFFNGYFMGHLDYAKIQKIEACVGAFIMLKRKVGEEIAWWNEAYFMYGEDLDLCYQIHKHGYNLYFYPFARITHYQGVSSGIKSHTSKTTTAKRETKVRSARATTNAMRKFYQLNLIDKYPPFVRPIVTSGINFLEFYRVFKARYL